MPGHADWQPVLSAARENAVPIPANSSAPTPSAVHQLEIATFLRRAVDNLQIARLIHSTRMDLHATVAKHTASLESARHTTHNAKSTSEQVSQPGQLPTHTQQTFEHTIKWIAANVEKTQDLYSLSF